MLPSTDAYDYLVVVPTVAEPDVLVAAMRRHILHRAPRTLFVLSANPISVERSQQALSAITDLWAGRADPEDGCALVEVNAGAPVGFARAVNAGLRAASGLPPITVVINDDAHVCTGWLLGLRSALDTDTVKLTGEPGNPDRDAADYGRIGFVGPVSDVVAGVQNLGLDKNQRAAAAGDPDGFAYQVRQGNPGAVLACDFLSGFCIAVKREALLDVTELNDEGEPCLFDERFGVGGYEDNDLVVRAENAGWRCAVAGEVFVRHVGHQTLDKHFPGQMRGTAIGNRLSYMRKHATMTQAPDQKCVAVYRFGPRVAHDLVLMRESLRGVGRLVDGVAVLLTSNPVEVARAFDWQQLQQQGALSPHEVALVKACNGAEPAAVEEAFSAWVYSVLRWGTEGRDWDLSVEVWLGEPNERVERNRSIEMGESLGADWLLSVDHDEAPEPRIERTHIQRAMTHPDPLVRAWDFAWLNHWDQPHLVRVDSPWSDPDYRYSMRGFRLWRVCKASPRRIMAGNPIGLHCGNCPDHDPTAKRVLNFRWRHFGYLRAEDRRRKQANYQAIDPSPDAALTGGSYDHLVERGQMRMETLFPATGIGFSMLVHAGEKPEDIARHLDGMHGMADDIALVWTEEDPEIPASLLELTRLHGARWIHHPLADNFAEARNAGLDALRGRKEIGWAVMLDPDEHFDEPFTNLVSMRRMAECATTYGWLFRFVNHRQGQAPSMSDTPRMVRLDPEGRMRYDGRVHEGFHKAAQSFSPAYRPAPFVMHNPGLAGDDLAQERKLRFYQRLLIKQLEEDPLHAGSWLSLGLQLENDGHMDEALTCFERATKCGSDGYLPPIELAQHYLRRAAALYRFGMERLHPGHFRHESASAVAKQVIDIGRPLMLSGLARRGQAPVLPPVLPPFPGDAPPQGE